MRAWAILVGIAVVCAVVLWWSAGSAPSPTRAPDTQEVAIEDERNQPTRGALSARIADAGIGRAVTASDRMSERDWFARAESIAERKRLRSRACLELDEDRCGDELFEGTFRALLVDPAFLEFVQELLHSMSPEALGELLRAWLNSDDPSERAVALAAMRSGLLPHTEVPDAALTRTGRSTVERGYLLDHVLDDTEWTTERREVIRGLAASDDDRIVRRSLAGLGVHADSELAGVVGAYSAEQLGVTTSRFATRALSNCGAECIDAFAPYALTSPRHARVFVESVAGAGSEYRASQVVETALTEVRRVYRRDDEVQGSLSRLP